MQIILCKKYQESCQAWMRLHCQVKKECISSQITQKGLEAWIELQTMLINENHLDLSDKSNRRWLNEQMELFWAIKTINDPQDTFQNN